jgi:hypothetical protein
MWIGGECGRALEAEVTDIDTFVHRLEQPGEGVGAAFRYRSFGFCQF